MNTVENNSKSRIRRVLDSTLDWCGPLKVPSSENRRRKSFWLMIFWGSMAALQALYFFAQTVDIMMPLLGYQHIGLYNNPFSMLAPLIFSFVFTAKTYAYYLSLYENSTYFGGKGTRQS